MNRAIIHAAVMRGMVMRSHHVINQNRQCVAFMTTSTQRDIASINCSQLLFPSVTFSSTISPSLQRFVTLHDDNDAELLLKHLNKLSLTGKTVYAMLPQENLFPVVGYEQRKSILDPVARSTIVRLPTRMVVDRFAPPTVGNSVNTGNTVVPILDPYPSGMGRVVPEKIGRQLSIIRIRHKKMKKHKRRKLRKRMRFLRRRLEAKKDRKKEKAMQEFERTQAKLAMDYDADKVIEEHLQRARDAGWGIDILAERGAKKYSNQNTSAGK